ncbi:MAG: hypothetical protein IPG01_16785 [Chitinophagaceae bacterium]|nr:hypothetical protein [Chitinophagaceae bacterium]
MKNLMPHQFAISGELEAAATLKRKCVIVYKNAIEDSALKRRYFQNIRHPKTTRSLQHSRDGTVFDDKLVSMDGKVMPGIS